MGDTLVTRAFVLAAQVHATQTRKASLIPATPYLGHLMEVAGMVMSSGAPEVVVAAALLHDAIEDQGAGTRILIQEQLGDEVLRLVEECTEPGTGGPIRAPWRERKEGYLRQTHAATSYALLIKCADKLHNARDLRKQVWFEGARAYTAFSTGKDEKLWFYDAFAQAARQRLSALETQQPEEPLLKAIAYLLNDLQSILHDLHHSPSSPS